jgi:hypothetical protein
MNGLSLLADAILGCKLPFSQTLNDTLIMLSINLCERQAR